MAQSNAQAELAHLISIAEVARRGAPFGELGRTGPVQPHPTARDVDETAPVLLASGLLDDDGRQALTPGHDLYGLFLHALRWQDTWSEAEHGSFWGGALRLWPPTRGKRGHTDALAYALVIAIEAGVDLDEFLDQLGRGLQRKPIRGLTAEKFTLRSLQRRDSVRIAIEMIHAPRHLYPESGRLPRVLTEDETVPRLAIAPPSIEGYSKAGDASSEIVQAAHRAIQTLRRHNSPPT